MSQVECPSCGAPMWAGGRCPWDSGSGCTGRQLDSAPISRIAEPRPAPRPAPVQNGPWTGVCADCGRETQRKGVNGYGRSPSRCDACFPAWRRRSKVEAVRRLRERRRAQATAA